MHLEQLRELERRLSEAKGCYESVDAALAKAIDAAFPFETDPDARYELISAVSGSLDAAIALVERVLPGAEVTLRMGSKSADGRPLDATARLALPFQGSFGLMFRYQPEECHADVILALCLATIRALIAKDEE